MAGPFDDFPSGANSQASGDGEGTPSPLGEFPTLGGNIPQRSYYGSGRGAAERQYQSIGPFRRARAGAHNIINSIPVVRNIPGAGDIARPEDVELSNFVRPGLSSIERGYGHSLPYLAAGTAFPRTLFSLPVAMGTGATIEGADALTGNRNVPEAAFRGAASAVPGYLLSRTFSPLSPQTAAQRTLARETQTNAETSKAILKVLSGGREASPGSPFSNAIRDALHTADETLRTTPSLGITRLPPALENAAIGAVGGHYLANNPIMGAVAGYAIPRLAGVGARAGQTAFRRLTENPGIGRTLLENQFLNNPMRRALLQALSQPTVQEAFPTLSGR
jgi:hypothetical protein